MNRYLPTYPPYSSNFVDVNLKRKLIYLKRIFIVQSDCALRFD